MKKLFLLILILASNLFAQEWNPTVTTGIGIAEKNDIFTNSSGIHILVRDLSGYIVYYNLNSEGTVCTTKTVTFETGDFPNIVGSNDKIYAIYKTTDYKIRVKYSTDNGSSWIWNSNLDRLTSDKDCNGVDAVYELGNGVHLVWATQDSNTPSGFETYYYRLNTDHSWVDYQNVTDVSTGTAQTGGNPSVAVSQNRVHVSFNTDATTSIIDPGEAITRDKYNGYWQTPQTAVPGSEQSIDEKLLVSGDYLYLFYNRVGTQANDFRYRRKSFSGSWSDPTTLETGTLYQYEDAFNLTKTSNNYIHIIYKYHDQTDGWSYRYNYYNGTNWSYTNLEHPSVGLRQIGLSSVSNDLFCTWVKYGISYLRFKQYDAIPLTPPNFTGTSYNNHPKLTWTKIEPDIQYFEIYWQLVDDPKHPGSWNLLTTTSSTSFVDYGVQLGGREWGDVNYKIRSKDYSDNFSSYTGIVTFVYSGLNKTVAVNDLKEYKLFSNYPNPFNPSTQISYSINEEGLVTLKVYDVLGKEIATLVNENKVAGNYEVEFNASELPSGMYIYKLQAGSFTDVKKMLLTK